MATNQSALAAVQEAHDEVSALAGVPTMSEQLAAKDASIATAQSALAAANAQVATLTSQLAAANAKIVAGRTALA